MNKPMLDLHGLFSPIPTAFTDDGSSLSEVRQARLVRRLVAQGVDGLVVGTELGEFTALSHGERKQLVEWVVRDAHGAPVLANVSSLSTSVSLDLAQHAARHGARAAILTPPFFGDFGEDEVVAFFRTVAQYAGLPLIAIDPFDDFAGDLRSRVLELPGVWVARPLDQAGYASLAVFGLAHPDEFALGEAVCTPLAGLATEAVRACIHVSGPGPVALRNALRQLSLMRAVKAAFEELGVQVGAPRGPATGLGAESRKKLAACLAELADAA